MTNTHKKVYRGSKATDRTCRNHGTCPTCRGNRLHQGRKEDARTALCSWCGGTGYVVQGGNCVACPECQES